MAQDQDTQADAGPAEEARGPHARDAPDAAPDAADAAGGRASEAAVREPAEGPADVVDEAPADARGEADALRAQLGEMQERYMRALAEAENVRRRADRDRREAEQYGGSRLARDLLPVFDNLTRAVEAVTDEQRAAAGPVIEGVELTLRELISVMGRHGMEPIAPEVGERFDPQAHQAMFEAPVPDTRAGDIIQVMARGFMLHDRLLRPAQVGVSSTSAS